MALPECGRFEKNISSLFTTQSRLLTTLQKKACEIIVGKGENAGNQHFLLVPHNVFWPIKEKNHHFSNIKFVVCKCFQFSLGRILSFGKELIIFRLVDDKDLDQSVMKIQSVLESVLSDV